MSEGLQMTTAPTMSLTATPTMIMNAKLLTLSAAELDQAIAQELADNPALVQDTAQPCPECGSELAERRCPQCDAHRSPVGAERCGSINSSFCGDVAAPEPWREKLCRDLQLELPASHRPLATLIVGSLDDHGYLADDLGTVTSLAGANPDTVDTVLHALQRVSGGAGSSGPVDCLLFQVQHAEISACYRALLGKIIGSHLGALAAGRFASIAHQLDVPTEDVVRARQFIRDHLQPRPILRQSDGPGRMCIEPDVAIIPADAERFRVDVVAARRVGIGVDPDFRRLARHDRSGHLSELVAGADFFLARLRQRWQTLRVVTATVADRQQSFLRDGPRSHVPLTRTEVADAVNVHPSTVSRAVAGKYVELPSREVIPFHRLFDRATTVRCELRSIIDAENVPLSDHDLADRLRSAGYDVARRTVSKYREDMGIPARALR